MTSTSWMRCGVELLYDLLDTSKGSVAIMIAISIHGYWNPEDLVLRNKQKLDNMNKLSSKWEGPYQVTHTLRPGAVYLEDEKGRPEGNAWNIENLRKFDP